MTHAGEGKSRAATFERIYEASVEEVWTLWTTKEGLEEWFAPEGFRVEMHALDVRVGGAFVHEMTAVRDDQVAYMTSVGRPRATRVHGWFVEVIAHERLHIRMTVDFVPGLEAHPIDIVVTFASEGARVRMVVTAGPHPDVELTRLAGEGMTSQLRRLDSALASRGRRCALDGAADTGILTFALNVTLDGCCDHRRMIADDEMLDHFTRLIGAAGAILYGRTTYELMEDAWPAVARDENAPRAMREWARKLEDMPKYVVSGSRRDFPWNNSFHVEGDLRDAVMQLKERTPRGVLVGSPMLSAALERLGLLDEYHLVVHPVLAGHGPYLFQGLDCPRHLDLVSTTRLESGVTTTHYRRKEGSSSFIARSSTANTP